MDIFTGFLFSEKLFLKNIKKNLEIRKQITYICQTIKANKMKEILINPIFLSDNNTFKFVPVESMYYGFTDVMYKGVRIAILNGVSSPLQWTVKNGSNIPLKVIEQLEKMAQKLIVKTAKNK